MYVALWQPASITPQFRFEPRPWPTLSTMERKPTRRSTAPGADCDQSGIGWALAAVALLVAAAYSQTFAVPFLYDDISSIANNPSIRHLSTAFWPPVDATVTGRPVLNLSFAINYAISGTALWGYHAANLAIHVLAGLTLFGIVRRTLSPPLDKRATVTALAATLLWSLHPLNTQAVTYIAQRAESLMGLFFLCTLYFFIRGIGTAEKMRFPWFALSVASCLLGMSTKEVMASAPLIVLLYDRTFVAGSFRDALRSRWKVHSAMAGTWLVLLLLVFTSNSRSEAAGSGAGVVWWQYALTQFPAICHYLRLCFWPYPLIFDYGTALGLPSLHVLPYALLVVALVAATLWAIVFKPAVGFLGAVFFAVLAPSSSIVPVVGETMADYRMYLPLIPVVVLAVLGMQRWLGRAALPACLILAASLGAATAARNRDYFSAKEIWTDTVAKRPDNFRARNNLAVVLLNTPGRLDDAIAQYQAALRLNPNSAEGHVNLANALSNARGRLDDAIAHYAQALSLEPGLYGAHVGMGNALMRVPGRMDDAVAEYEDAVRLKPDAAEGHFNLGNALLRTPGRLNDSVSQFKEALRLKPDFAVAHFSLALALLNLPGRTQEAKAHLEEGLRIQPNDAQARQILANIQSQER
jgi:tetratricopeptide (TPR) repeat protein